MSIKSPSLHHSITHPTFWRILPTGSGAWELPMHIGNPLPLNLHELARLPRAGRFPAHMHALAIAQFPFSLLEHYNTTRIYPAPLPCAFRLPFYPCCFWACLHPRLCFKSSFHLRSNRNSLQLDLAEPDFDRHQEITNASLHSQSPTAFVVPGRPVSHSATPTRQTTKAI